MWYNEEFFKVHVMLEVTLPSEKIQEFLYSFSIFVLWTQSLTLIECFQKFLSTILCNSRDPSHSTSSKYQPFPFYNIKQHYSNSPSSILQEFNSAKYCAMPQKMMHQMPWQGRQWKRQELFNMRILINLKAMQIQLPDCQYIAKREGLNSHIIVI